MRGIAFLFFATAAIYVLAGMLFGIHMAASHDYLLSPAHAHLNLVGWVTMGMFGLYYHNVPDAARSKLAKLHFLLATAGLWLMVPGIALALEGVTETFAIAGSLATVLSMALFVIIVFKNGRLRAATH